MSIKIIKNIVEDELEHIWFQKNREKMNRFKKLIDIRSTKTINKLFHFIWIGPKKIPKKYISYIQTWIDKHPDWKFCLWTDKNIPNLINDKEYESAEKYAMKADILRYELLYIFGGVYVDCDFICHKNIRGKIKNLKGFSAWESDLFIAIGLMGFTAKHPFLKDVINQIKINCVEKCGEEINRITGPVMFTDLWKQNSHGVYAFPPSFCYPYTFQDHFYEKEYVYDNKAYASHMWGNSWGDNYNETDFSLNGFSDLSISGLFKLHDNKIKNIEDFSYKNRKRILHYPKHSQKKKIVHIMGLFYSGGIERLIYYFDKYGDFDKYDYYLLYMKYPSEKVFYPLNRIIMIEQENFKEISDLLEVINPDIVVDHLSLYFGNNDEMYESFNREKVITMVHSATKYDIDVTGYKIENCIHLYDEKRKHLSWNSIPNNFYITLGTELVEYEKHINKILKIGIIGRVAQEKLPIDFFKKLCVFSNRTNLQFHIYGEKDYLYSSGYADQFDSLIKDSSIKYHGFVDPEKIGDVYKMLDILLIPSEYETGSFSCIEALNYGVVVISRDVYGMSSIIDNHVGYLCDNDEHIITVLETLDRSKIKRRSRRSIRQSKKYDIKEKIKEIEQLF